MNIRQATILAKQGHVIYRLSENDPDDIVTSVYIVKDGKGNLSFMNDMAHYTILSPEDCLADDWEIVK